MELAGKTELLKKQLSKKLGHEVLVKYFTKEYFFLFWSAYKQIRYAVGFELSTETYVKVFRCVHYSQDVTEYTESFDLAMKELKTFNNNLYYAVVKYVSTANKDKYLKELTPLFEFYTYNEMYAICRDNKVREQLDLLFDNTQKLDKQIASYFKASQEDFESLLDFASNYNFKLSNETYEKILNLLNNNRVDFAFIELLKEAFVKSKIVAYKYNNKLKFAKI